MCTCGVAVRQNPLLDERRFLTQDSYAHQVADTGTRDPVLRSQSRSTVTGPRPVAQVERDDGSGGTISPVPPTTTVDVHPLLNLVTDHVSFTTYTNKNF